MLPTRKTLAERAQGLGIPLKHSRIDKECMAGNGPPVCAHWGRQELYEEEAGLAWARSLLRFEPEGGR